MDAWPFRIPRRSRAKGSPIARKAGLGEVQLGYAVGEGGDMGRFLGFTACALVAFILFYASARTPWQASASAPATEFSARRAMVDVAAMAPVPHPVGSAAHAAVRDYLVTRMTALGLSPQVQRAHSQRMAGKASNLVLGGDVENVIGVLPGRSRTAPALVLMAHYDSVQGSPGAADDIAGVATALEIVRAIKAQGVPARDVMLVMTDGEEAGLLGANAFFGQSPLAAHAGFVINLESRGGGGRAIMFQTGPDNGAVIDLYRRTAVTPESNSLSVFIYKLLPNDTDFSVSLEKGLPGLNYAFIGRQFDYHSPSSTVAALDKGSVQQMGQQVLPTARALAFDAALPGKAPDMTYATAAGDHLIAYPAQTGWLVLAVIAALIVFAGLRARRHEPVGALDMLQGAGAGLLMLVASALLLHLVRHATGIGFGWIAGRALLARFPTFELAMAFVAIATIFQVAAGVAHGKGLIVPALAALVAGLAATFFSKHGLDLLAIELGVGAAVLSVVLFRRPASLAGSWIGLMLLALVAAVVLQVIAPTVAMVIAWPLAVAAVCAALTGAGTSHGPIATLARLLAWLLSAIALAWILGLFHSLLQGLDIPELPAATVLLAALLVWPMVWPHEPEHQSHSTAGNLFILLGLAVALWLHAISPWSARHPNIAMPLYVIDNDSGGDFRVSPYAPDAWVKGVLETDGGAVGRRTFPGLLGLARSTEPSWAATARKVAAPAFALTQTRGADGTVTLHATGQAEGLLSLLLRPDTPVSDVKVNGAPMAVLAKPGQWTQLVWQAAPEGVTVSFKPSGPGSLDVRYAQSTPHWPVDAVALPPMPDKLMPWNLAGATVVTGTRKASW